MLLDRLWPWESNRHAAKVELRELRSVVEKFESDRSEARRVEKDACRSAINLNCLLSEGGTVLRRRRGGVALVSPRGGSEGPPSLPALPPL